MNLIGPLGAGTDAALARLKRALQAQPGFQLILLETPEGPARDRVLEIVLGWGGREGVPKLRRVRARGRSEMVGKLASRHGGIVLDDMDTVLLDDAVVNRFVGAMNWHRDQLRARIVGPLILAISARGVARLFERAPDLATWRSHTCRITPGDGLLEDRVKAVLSAREPDPIDLDRAEAVLSSVQARGGPPDETADALFRLGRAREGCGDLMQARESYEGAAKLATDQTDIRAWALHSLARLDLADRQLKDAHGRWLELLPLLSRSRNPGLQASAASLRAEIATVEGDAEMALRLYREAADAVADRTDLHGAAQYLLAIALFTLGEVEEALSVVRAAHHELKDARLAVRALNLEARIESSRNRPDLAIARLEEAVALARNASDLRGLHLEMCVRLAGEFLAIGRYSEVRRTLRRVQAAMKDAPPPLRAKAAFFDGAAAARLKRKTAFACLEQAIALTHDPTLKALAKLMLSVEQAKAGNTATARRTAASGLQLAKESKRPDVLEAAQELHNSFFPPPKKAPRAIAAPARSTPVRRVTTKRRHRPQRSARRAAAGR